MAFRARLSLALLSCVLLAGVTDTELMAQQSPPSGAPRPAALTLPEILALAEAQVEIAAVLDSSGAQLAHVRNKTEEAQKEMRLKRAEMIASAITKRGMTAEEFDRRRYVVSMDGRMRFQLDSIVAKLTGQPLPGTYIAPAPAVAEPAAPALPGQVGIAVGYVAGSYLDTPDKAGLLATAVTEANTASQHAALMARAPDNLASMQLHAGHVLHALDPRTMPNAKAPGKGYGVKRALEGAVAYMEVATKDAGATANIKTHAAHVTAASRSAAARADQVIALARRIQDASDATTAAALVGQLQSLCDQIVAGADLNADGRIAFGDGEGGIRQAQDHIGLLVAGEKK